MFQFAAIIAIDTNKGTVMEALITHEESQNEAIAFVKGYLLGGQYPAESKYRIVELPSPKSEKDAMEQIMLIMNMAYGDANEERRGNARDMNLTDYIKELGAGVIPDEFNDNDRDGKDPLTRGARWNDE